MVSMPTVRASRTTSILGPCPGCRIWTLQYDDEVVAEFSVIRLDEAGHPVVDLQHFYAAVEEVLAEHLDECHGLRGLLA